MSDTRRKLFLICINQKTRFFLINNQVIDIILFHKVLRNSNWTVLTLNQFECCSSRSSHLELLFKIAVLKNVTKYKKALVLESVLKSLF